MIAWKSKKQIVVARSSVRAEYRAMEQTSCELMWIKHLLEELKFVLKVPMTMLCDNQATIHIASNHVFYERTKYIEVDCHIIQEKVEDGVITTPYFSTRVQIVDMFTKSLCKKLIWIYYVI